MREPNEADDPAVARVRAADAAPLRSVAALPGPRGWPLIGNLLQFDLPRLHRQFEDWADRHGPTYRLRLGRREVLVISDAETIAALLRDRPDTWRRMRPIEAVIREAGGHGVFSAEGDDWRRQRRLVMSAFDPGHLKRFYPSLQRVTERLMASWREAARRGEAIDLQASLMRYTVDVTTGLAFGVDLNTIDTPHPLQEHLDKLFPMLFRRVNLPFPYWHYLRLPIDREYDRHLRRVHEAVRGFVQAARQRLQDEPTRRERPTDLLEAMLAARDADGSALTEEEVAGNVLTVLLAGEDTTANTLGWAIWLLHEHPDDWRALVAEVDAALGEARLPPSFDAARGPGLDRGQRRRGDAPQAGGALAVHGGHPRDVTGWLSPAARRRGVLSDAARGARCPAGRGRGGLPAGPLARRRRPGRAEGLDAVRCRPPPVPRPLPRTAGDEDGAGHAGAQLRTARRRPGRRRGAGRAHGLHDVPGRAEDAAGGAGAALIARTAGRPRNRQGRAARRPSSAREAAT